MEKVDRHSGLGEVTALSDGIIGLYSSGKDRNTHIEAMQETELVLYDVTQNLLERTGIPPSEVGPPSYPPLGFIFGGDGVGVGLHLILSSTGFQF